MTRPNPLTDELDDDAKAKLAAVFARMKRVQDRRDNHYAAFCERVDRERAERLKPWQENRRTGW